MDSNFAIIFSAVFISNIVLSYTQILLEIKYFIDIG